MPESEVLRGAPATTLVLRVADPGGGNGALVLELDKDGRVDEWRIGVPPQVDYVEGCS